MYPIISTINDVLPHIEHCESISVIEKDDYDVINYRLQDSDTFPMGDNLTARMRRECRGLIFAKDGTLLRRAYHKFFNLGERDIHTFDVTKDHVILEKLDGSMITPLWIDGVCRLATKAGITDTSIAAEIALVSSKEWDKYLHAFAWFEDCGLTPIFEWCDPVNPIVISHAKPELVLTAVRHRKEGWYYTYGLMNWCAASFDLPIVKRVWEETGACVQHVDDFADAIRNQQDTEGVVVRFENIDGDMIKVKTDWYVAIHKAKENILWEKNVIRLILEAKLDDVVPYLADHDKAHVQRFVDSFSHGLYVTQNDLLHVAAMAKQQTRKEFALNTAPHLPAGYAPIIFKVWGNADINVLSEQLDQFILSNISSNAKVDRIRHLWGGAKWKDAVQE